MIAGTQNIILSGDGGVEHLGGAPIVPVLYPYQRKYLQDKSRFKSAMWSRQVGKTFTTTLEAVLDCLEAEAQGKASHWTILSISKARALDAMNSGVKVHLAAFKALFEYMEIPLEDKQLSLEVSLPHGSRIRCVAANPSTARGMTENLILDEFAHHVDTRAIWTALIPVVSSPHLKLRVISTPNGKGNKYYDVMTAPESLFSRHVVTIYDAVNDGLPRNIDELRKLMNDDIAFAQEFECSFIDGASAWLTFQLIDDCQHPDANCPEKYMGGPCYVGMDLARRGDLTIISVLEKHEGVLWLREMIEMRNTKFSEQLKALDNVMTRYKVMRVCMDKTGLGEMPVETAQEKYGEGRVNGILFSLVTKMAMAMAIKRVMEDDALRIHASPELRADLHSIKRIPGNNGLPKFNPENDAGDGDSGGSHADRFWSLALGVLASDTNIPDFSQCAAVGKTSTSKLSGYLPTNTGWGTVQRIDHGSY